MMSFFRMYALIIPAFLPSLSHLTQVKAPKKVKKKGQSDAVQFEEKSADKAVEPAAKVQYIVASSNLV